LTIICKQKRIIGEYTKSTELDPSSKRDLWFILAGTSRIVNRAKILNLITDTPMTTNQIAIALNLDYKTITHHVKILSKNKLIIKMGKNYEIKYELTQIMKENQSLLNDIFQKIGIR
jgi:DNA-binding transcriptional ArsR family regulator